MDDYDVRDEYGSFRGSIIPHKRSGFEQMGDDLFGILFLIGFVGAVAYSILKHIFAIVIIISIICIVATLFFLWPTKTRKAKKNFNKGMVLLNKGNFDDAIIYFNISINLNSSFLYAYEWRAYSYIEIGNKYLNTNAHTANYIKAIKDYTTIINSKNLTNEYKGKLHMSRGNVLKALQDYSGAIEDYTIIIELYPDFDDAYFKRGLCYEGNKEFKKAAADFQEAFILNPDNNLAKKHYLLNINKTVTL